MEMITRKRLLFIVAACFIGLVLVIALAVRQGISKTNSSEAGYTVTNLSEYEPKFDKLGIGKNIHTAIEEKITTDEGQSPTKSHSGNVRNDSFKTVKNDSGVPYSTILVDFPSLKRTYKVSLLGGDQYEQAILYIECPTEKELVYPAKECKGNS